MTVSATSLAHYEPYKSLPFGLVVLVVDHATLFLHFFPYGPRAIHILTQRMLDERTQNVILVDLMPILDNASTTHTAASGTRPRRATITAVAAGAGPSGTAAAET